MQKLGRAFLEPQESLLEALGRVYRLSIIGGEFRHNGVHKPCFAFVYALAAVRFMRPQAKDSLQIGLGIGSLPTVLETYGIRSDAVEIDPEVARFAQTYFGFHPTGTLYVEDARNFISQTKRKYDIVVHDTFSGGATPTHLLSLEVLRSIRRLLRPNGILVLNFVGYDHGPNAAAPEMVRRTLQVIFPHVRVFRDEPSSDTPSNLIFFASESAIELQVPPGATSSDKDELRTIRAMHDWEVLQSVPSGPIVTDRSNPLARLQLASAEAHFRAMNELLPTDVWLR